MDVSHGSWCLRCLVLFFACLLTDTPIFNVSASASPTVCCAPATPVHLCSDHQLRNWGSHHVLRTSPQQSRAGSRGNWTRSFFFRRSCHVTHGKLRCTPLSGVPFVAALGGSCHYQSRPLRSLAVSVSKTPRQEVVFCKRTDADLAGLQISDVPVQVSRGMKITYSRAIPCAASYNALLTGKLLFPSILSDCTSCLVPPWWHYY